MSVVLDAELMKVAYDTIGESATQMDSKENKEKPETIMYRYAPRFSVTNGVYSKYLKNNGVPADVVDKLTRLEQAWNAGAAKYATDQLKKMAPEALNDKEFMKAAGPKNIKATVYTTTTDGKRGVTVSAYSENRNPRATSEADATTVSYGSITLRHTITKDFDPNFAQSIRNDVEKLIRGKF